MGENLQPERSKMSLDNYHPGCMQSLLHVLDLHQRLYKRKTLGYRRNDGESRPGRVKTPKMKHHIPSTSEDNVYLDKDAKFLTEDKISPANRTSGKALMRNIICKRRNRQKDQKRKISPLASRLLRTSSIHRLECNDYVLPDELTSGSETSPVGLHSAEAASSSSQNRPSSSKTSGSPIIRKQCKVCGSINIADDKGHNRLGDHLLEKRTLLGEKLNEAKEALLKKQQSTHAGEAGRGVALLQSKEFLDMMELLNANRELILKILQDPTFIIANYLQGQQASGSEMVLTTSSSLPAAELSCRNSEALRLNHKSKESEPLSRKNGKLEAGSSPLVPNIIEDGSQAMESITDEEDEILTVEAENLDTAGTAPALGYLTGSFYISNDKKDRTLSNHFKTIKRRIKDVIKDNKKEHHRISMDGVLHKIPYGQKVSEDVKKEVQSLLERSASDKLNSYSSKGKFGRKGVASSKSGPVGGSIRKSFSLTESLDKYSHLFESISSREKKRLPACSVSTKEDSGLQVRKFPKAFERIFSLPELDSYSLSKDIQDEVSDASQSLEMLTSGPQIDDAVLDPYSYNKPKPVDNLVCTEESIKSDALTEHIVEVNANEQPILINELDHCDTYSISDNFVSEEDNYGSLHVISSDMPAEPSPISVTNLCAQEDLVSPAKDSVSEAGSELKTRQIDLEELDCSELKTRQTDLGSCWGIDDASNVVEGVETDFGKAPTSMELDDFNSSDIQVDEKDEAQFHYVRDILMKSGFSSDELLGEWYSPNQPVDPSLFEEAECSCYELDPAGYEPEMTLNHMLLFDLINEVLLEIYDSTFTYCPWLSRFDSRVRPMPAGYHVLEEVWAIISHHLSSQLQLDQTVEDIVARDFMKDDGWMSLQHDTEYIGLELEDLILDDLLAEVILQFDDLPSSLYVL
ncbi:uncharacterized protein LOC103716525 [Phoenix dactylifera]|uniref:Uncharacterized protein LOC103716525 n=1 Tax=Phoenix dactylifera TaxID=42345 RepID=A0A8B8J9I9_PHODC|nr:uncharacterized protein LOC103716525 [Phoenix dactylifera]